MPKSDATDTPPATRSLIASLDRVELTLSSRAGPVEILRSVSLDIEEGRSLAIVGPSGSGKTSLLMVLAGLEAVTRGRVAVAGADYSALDEDGRARLRAKDIGIVFQSFHLVPSMTAIENVALPMQFAHVSGADDVARGLLDDVGLGHRLRHYPSQLSGGEQQRVALARAVALKPRLLLADEPTGNLDGATGRQVIDMLFGLQRRNDATLVLVTHDETLAARADRVIRMADGRIVSDTAAAKSELVRTDDTAAITP
ncbi:MAG: ATP-binding cassette domain-containing protein [Hyphomicrobiaceae bacterium]|nr:ATP-binding cassette domain-containing protein [Hyphomicrobiaceae bacterium]